MLRRPGDLALAFVLTTSCAPTATSTSSPPPAPVAAEPAVYGDPDAPLEARFEGPRIATPGSTPTLALVERVTNTTSQPVVFAGATLPESAALRLEVRDAAGKSAGLGPPAMPPLTRPPPPTLAPGESISFALDLTLFDVAPGARLTVVDRDRLVRSRPFVFVVP